AEPREKGAAEWVACEQPVQIAPHHPAVGADRAIGMAVEIEHRSLQAGPARHPKMHLVSTDGHTGHTIAACHLCEALVAAEHGLDVEQPEPKHLRGRSFAAVRIGDPAAQHLITAAEAEDMATLAMMREQIDVPAVVAHEGEIGEGRLRAGED